MGFDSVSVGFVERVALGVHLISVASQHRFSARDKAYGKVASSGLC